LVSLACCHVKREDTVLAQEHELQINFESLVANLADGVYFADPQGKIIYANQGLSNLLGYESPSEVMGMFLYDFLDGKNAKRIREFYDQGPKKFGTARLEMKLLRSDGSFVWTEARPTLKNLNTCPKGSFGVVRDISEFKRLEERLHNLAITDDLTGLYNRRGFRLMAEQELKHAKRINAETMLLSIDVDDFKSINDTFGHNEGDMVLKMVATTLIESFRETDIITRWGGDEFIVLALDAPSGFVPLLADRFQQNLTINAQKKLLPYPVAVTIGTESTDIFEDFTLNRLIMGADRHMYQLKKEKRGQ
jgi:diguanylate cyclase (GGDEF)-like protein/PAS domain S-box-containing protein